MHCDLPDTPNAPSVALIAPLAALGLFHDPASTQKLAHDEVVDILEKKAQSPKSARGGWVGTDIIAPI